MDLKIGDKVDVLVGRSTDIGFVVMVNEKYEGLLYKNELYQLIKEGNELIGYVKKIRDDGKLDISLQPIGFKQAYATDEVKILEALKQNDGFLALNDKSSPDTIKRTLEMSKKAFKRAIGGLFKQKKIAILKDGIRLL